MAYYNTEKVQRKKQPLKYIIFALIIIALLAISYFLYAQTKVEGSAIERLYSQYSCYWDTAPVATEFGQVGERKRVFIEAGASVDTIAEVLFQQQVISNKEYFICYAKKNRATFLAGVFVIEQPKSLEALLPLFKIQRIQAAKVIIREGLRADEIGTIIETELKASDPDALFSAENFSRLIVDKDFIKLQNLGEIGTLEGYLFPDTYEISTTANTQSVTELLLRTYKIKVTTTLNTEFSTSKLSKPDIMIIASLIEKESTGLLQEKKMIADIIIRRLQNGWFLNIDAAFLYAKKDWKFPLTSADLKIDNPYNTYTRKGLPPTPICNPGVLSITAVLTPEKNDYWYYLHDKNGTIRYAKTYSEHQQNITKYLQ